METTLKDEFTCYLNFAYLLIELFHFRINKLTYLIRYSIRKPFILNVNH